MQKNQINKSEVEQFFNKEFDNNFVPNLMEFIRIPNLSPDYDQNWQTNGLQEKCAEFLVNWVKQQNLQNTKIEIVQEKLETPNIIVTVEGTGQGNILMYGHFDKQPHMTGWNEGLSPIDPKIKEDKLYGRGAADDGYSIFAAVLAIKACQNLNYPHPRCVIFIEGCEESGSKHIEGVLNKKLKEIGDVDLVIVLDSGALDYQNLWITQSLRGNLKVTVSIKVLKEGIHSGNSGPVPSSFRIMRQLLDRIDNPVTGEVNSAFQVDIPPEIYEQFYQTAKLLGKKEIYDIYPWFEKMQPTDDNPLHAYINKVWKPQLSIVGFDGLPVPEIAGNVVAAESIVKLSLRLPPMLDAKKALNDLKEILNSDVPYNASLTFPQASSGQGFCAPKSPEFLYNSIQNSSQNYFGQSAKYMSEGGSIPILSTMQEKFQNSQFLVTGVLGPFANAHGPNEMLQLTFTKKLMCCMTQIISEFAQNFKK